MAQRTRKTEFMQMAIQAARKGIRRNEGGPFGACIVKGGAVLAVAHNTVLRNNDPTCHAEVNAIRAACRKLKKLDLQGCVLYATAEPCPMCLGAIYWARISRLVIGVPKAIAGQYGFSDRLIEKEMRLPLRKRRVRTEQGVLAAECRRLFKEWKHLQRLLY